MNDLHLFRLISWESASVGVSFYINYDRYQYVGLHCFNTSRDRKVLALKSNVNHLSFSFTCEVGSEGFHMSVPLLQV